MKKFLFVAMSAIVLMACGNGNDPDQGGGGLTPKEKAALEFFGAQSRTTLFMGKGDAFQKMSDLGFTPYSTDRPHHYVPRKARNMSSETWRFFMNAPEVEGWGGYASRTDEQQEAFNQVMKAGKVYLEADLISFEGIITQISLLIRAKSDLENVNNIAISLFESAWNDYQTDNEGLYRSWGGSGDVIGKNPYFSSWPNMKPFFTANPHVYASCDGVWLYPENPHPYQSKTMQRTYNYSINWTDDETGLEDELPELPIVYGAFEANSAYYTPEEEGEE